MDAVAPPEAAVLTVVAPGVLRRSLTVHEVIDRILERWNDHVHLVNAEHYAATEERPRSLRCEVLSQFTPRARRLAA